MKRNNRFSVRSKVRCAFPPHYSIIHNVSIEISLESNCGIKNKLLLQ